MRFKKDEFVVERRYRLQPALLKEGVAVDAEEQTLLVPLRAARGDFGARMIFLSDVSERMWALLCEGRSLDEVASVVAAEYDVEPPRARADLEKLVAELCARGALAPLAPVPE